MDMVIESTCPGSKEVPEEQGRGGKGYILYWRPDMYIFLYHIGIPLNPCFSGPYVARDE